MKKLLLVIASVILLNSSSSNAQSKAVPQEKLLAIIGNMHLQIVLLTEENIALKDELDALKEKTK